jgi:hypothetical protein
VTGGATQVTAIFHDAPYSKSLGGEHESSKSQWVGIAYKGAAREPVRSNNRDSFSSSWSVRSGEVLVDDLSVVKTRPGAVGFMQQGLHGRHLR